MVHIADVLVKVALKITVWCTHFMSTITDIPVNYVSFLNPKFPCVLFTPALLIETYTIYVWGRMHHICTWILAAIQPTVTLV